MKRKQNIIYGLDWLVQRVNIFGTIVDVLFRATRLKFSQALCESVIQ